MGFAGLGSESPQLNDDDIRISDFCPLSRRRFRDYAGNLPGPRQLRDLLIRAWEKLWYWIVTLINWIRGLFGKPRL